MKENSIDTVMTQAYRRMHRYTCAEASLQALLDIWDLPKENCSWATAGYLGAILSGQTTCGVLIGSGIAIGFRCGFGKEEVPEQHEPERGTAITAVNSLYKDFIEEFGSTDCKTLNRLDFGNAEDFAQWTVSKGWRKTCDVFLDYAINKCMKMDL